MEKWEAITKDTLKRLSYDEGLPDSIIAERYGVTVGQVRYKRKKFGLSMRDKITEKMFDDFAAGKGELFKQLNAQAKERLLKKENIDGIAKALTHYVFRNGPVENMHADGKLTQEDMKTLNKFMVDRFAGLLDEIAEGRWLQIELLYNYYLNYGTDWDKAQADKSEFDLILKSKLNRLKNHEVENK